MAKTKKPTPTPFTLSKKWIVWAIAMVILGTLAAKNEIGLKNQLNLFVSELGLLIFFPYLLVNLNRFRKIRKTKKEDAIPGFDEIDKSLLSPFSIVPIITGLGYVMFFLFLASLISTFFQKIDFVAIFGLLFLVIVSVGMLYSRKYVFNGSKFWRKYLLAATLTIILVDFTMVLVSKIIATLIVFPGIFLYSLFIIIGVLKNRPTTAGESPHKWLALFLTLAPLAATIVISILNGATSP